MKLITFDFEGTLVDNQWNHKEAEKKVISSLEEKGISPDYFKGMNYTTIFNLVDEKEKEWGFSVNDLKSLLDSIYDYYDIDASTRWKHVEGLHSLLNNLKETYKLALVTNGGRKGMEQTLKKFNLENIFGLVVTRNDVERLKPSGEGLNKALEWAGVDKSNALHVGDSMADILAAREAGIKVAIIIGNNKNPDQLIKENPDLVLEKLTDLPKSLKKINF